VTLYIERQELPRGANAPRAAIPVANNAPVFGCPGQYLFERIFARRPRVIFAACNRVFHTAENLPKMDDNVMADKIDLQRCWIDVGVV
jgi:hypothetical protein